MQIQKYILKFFCFDLAETQRKSFLTFLEQGIICEFSKRNPITDLTQGLELVFFPKNYKLTTPKISPKQALLSSKTYESQLYVPAAFIDKQNKVFNLNWVLLGNFPLMTKRGHFIINGSPRVIVHQMVRSPGIYFQQKIVGIKIKNTVYYADLIPFRGSWIRLDIDKKGQFWVRLKKTPKIPLILFLQALGLNISQILNSIQYPENLERYLRGDNQDQKPNFLKDFSEPICAKNTTQALDFISSLIYPKKTVSSSTPEIGHKFLFRKFLNARTYDLGRMGRIRLNQKLGIAISTSHHTLTPPDFLGATNLLINFSLGLRAQDDIDDLKNRRVRTSGELLQNQLGTGLARLEKIIRERMKKAKNVGPQSSPLNLRALITTKAINGAFREFFGSSPLSQYMDQTNPLSEITHKRRLSSLGPGGITRETAGMAVRGIHPSHYGRICPIETPEGQNAGLVNSITVFSRINTHGFLETPFFSIFQGQLQHTKGLTFFCSEQEQKATVAPGDIKLSFSKFLPKKSIPVRYEQKIQKVKKKEIEFMAISSLQMISVATSLIPFLEHDDANRALMGSNMQRQAVSLMVPERPLVLTGLEASVIASSGQVIQAKQSGIISYISGNSIYLFFPKTFFHFQKKLMVSGTETKFVPSEKQSLHSMVCQQPWVVASKQSISAASRLRMVSSKNNPVSFFETLVLPIGKPVSKKETMSLMESVNKVDLDKIDTTSQVSEILVSYLAEFVQNPATKVSPLFFRRNKLLKLTKLEASCDRATNSKNFVMKPNNETSFARSETLSVPLLASHVLLIKSSTLVNKIWQKNNFRCSKATTSSENSLILGNLGDKSTELFQKKSQKRIESTLLTRERYSTLRKKLNPPDVNTPSLQVFTKRDIPLFYLPFFKKKGPTILDYRPCTVKAKVAARKLDKKQNFFQTLKYSVQGYERSNQDTCLKQRPSVYEGNWVQKGDILADCFSSVGGELSLGKNVFVAYMPWEGYNFEDAILISQRLVVDDSYTSIHIERYETEVRETKFGVEKITLPEIQDNQIAHLDHNGIVKLGSFVKHGDVLVGKVTPVKKKQPVSFSKLVSDIVEKQPPNTKDTSLRVPKGVKGRVVYTKIVESVSLASSEATIFPVLKKDETATNVFSKKDLWAKKNPQISFGNDVAALNKENSQKKRKKKFILSQLSPLLKKDKNNLFVAPNFVGCTVQINKQKLFPKGWYHADYQIGSLINKKNNLLDYSLEPKKVYIYLAEKRIIQRGDKLAGRHGNKGIVSQILPRQDMPYLPDGTPVDMVLNPLGVPSRMNVGQIFESLLGLAGHFLNEQYTIAPFDEAFGTEASRALVYSKLYQARLKTKQSWLFNPEFPGKMKIFDGRTDLCFDQPVTVGKAYMLKLIHLVDEKIHARSTGPYSLLTQQPLRGRSKQGGQRLGEMEVWALEGFGAAYTLQELLTIKSDDIQGRQQLMNAVLTKKPLPCNASEAFKVLFKELQSICLHVGLFASSWLQ